jgi:indole-3-glycerol phosphate synthase
VSDVLERILRSVEAALPALHPRRAELEAGAREAPPPRGFARAVRRPGEVAVIAEHKRRSPSAGAIAPRSDAARVCAAYADAGAAAVSVLTEGPHFGGAVADLEAARAACGVPILRKDFVLHPVQVAEARAAGADAVLLIVRALEAARLRELASAAADWGMDALVEVHDAAELDVALGAGAALVGINSRDLRTFTTDLARIEALAADVPEGVTVVGESGIGGPADVDRLGAAGVHAVLVGTTLMRSEAPAAALAELVGRPRAGAARPTSAEGVA